MRAVSPALLVLLGSLAPALPRAALAQQSAPPQRTRTIRPPRLLELVPAKLPPGTAFPSDLVTVLLRLEVDTAGRVRKATVVSGPPEPFRRASLKAARAFRFAPAKQPDGTAVPVTVTFRLRIRKPPPPPPPPVKLRGRLVERGTRKPLAGVEVQARHAGGLLAKTSTDARGRFNLTVAKARFTLVGLPTGHRKLDVVIRARPGEERDAVWYLDANPAPFETVVRATPVRTEVIRRTLPKAEIETVAGTQGDALKAIQNLPGVARPSFGGGPPVLRGAAPEDSRIFVEGQEIPRLFHFGGLRSTLSNVFLESVDFVPGNFSAAYGRATGGIINVRLRDPAKDMFRGMVDVNVYDAGIALEGPISKNWSLGGAFRRSYIDAILPAVLPSDAAVSFSTAPRFYDYQLLASWKPDNNRRLRILWYGSNDTVRILFPRPASDPAIRGNLDARLYFHTLQLSYRHRFSSDLTQKTSIAAGIEQIDTILGPERYFNLGVQRVALRSTWDWRLARNLKLRAGVDVFSGNVDIELNLPRRPDEGSVAVPLSTRENLALRKAAYLFQPAIFAELSWKPHPKLELLPGIRLDYYNVFDRLTVDPRLVIRYAVRPTTVLKAGVGLYQQPPRPDQADNTIGNPNLSAVRSVQTSLGIEQQLYPGVSLDFTGFYKRLDRLVVTNPDLRFDTSAPPYTNDATGRIFGLELSVKAKVGSWFQGYLAYTFQRSFRTDRPELAERPFDFDQPHILTLLGTFRLGRGWRTSFRFRLVSGNPRSPVLGSVYDARTDTYVPTYGEVNSARNATFHQLDLRVDKTWTFEKWKLSLYLDIQNVYNQGNQEGTTYSYDYRRSVRLTGLPILPLFGIKGQW